MIFLLEVVAAYVSYSIVLCTRRSGFQLRTRALSKDFVILELLRFPHFNPFPTQVLCYARIIYPY